jgi:integrase
MHSPTDLPPRARNPKHAAANVLAVQRLLGHETAAVTLGVYSHLFSDDLTKVAEALNKAAVAASDSLPG